MEKLSFCIPTYNRASYLKNCIESILGYAGRDIEIVIQDNASPDHTEQIVRNFSDGRIKYFRNNKNIGGVWNAMDIINNANGEYIYYLSDDDMLLPGAIERISDFILTYHPNAFKTDLMIFLEKTKKSYIYSYFNEDKYPGNSSANDIARIFMSSHVLTGVCFRKACLDMTYLKEYGDNWYPQMLLCGLSYRNLGYLAYPTAIHRGENETFWEINPNELAILRTGVVNIVRALAPRMEHDLHIHKEIVKECLMCWNIIEHDLMHFIDEKTLRTIRRIQMANVAKHRTYNMLSFLKKQIKRLAK